MLKSLLRLLAAGADRKRQTEDPREEPGAELAMAACREAVAYLEKGQFEMAETRLRAAIGSKHDLAEAHFLQGTIHERRDELDDAADCFRLAVHFDPRLKPAHFALASLFKKCGRLAEAAEQYRRVIEQDPNDVAAHCNLGHALHEMAEYAQAVVHAERALAIEPDLPEAHHNLGIALTALGRAAQAVPHIRRALEKEPRAEMAAALGHAYRDLGRLADAIASYDRALELTPECGDAIANRAYTFLLKGDYATGWIEYEKRFTATASGTRDFGLPRWNGEPLRDRTILVHAEQGVGDEIMFASCLPDLVSAAGRVVIECSKRLEPLFRRAFPGTFVHGGRKEDGADWLREVERPDFQISIGGLPRFFRGAAEAFPQHAGYLQADPDRTEYWAGNLRRMGSGLKAGLSWRGGTPKTRSPLRSIAPAVLAPLLAQPGVTFISLQHGADAGELGRYPGAAPVHTIDGLTEDFDALAGMICALDLVISVDNTNVHLAGALGRPVWVLLSASPEWRYGAGGEVMAWYPSARLFRQSRPCEWEPVVARVAAELAKRGAPKTAGDR